MQQLNLLERRAIVEPENKNKSFEVKRHFYFTTNLFPAPIEEKLTFFEEKQIITRMHQTEESPPTLHGVLSWIFWFR